MDWVTSMLIGVQVLCAIAIIVLVLLQHGKGADMGAAFGSGASGSLFGASGSANFLSRTTAVMAGLFFATTVGLGWSASHMRGQRPADAGGGGVMSTMPAGSAAPAPDAKQAPPADVPSAPAPATSEPAKPAPSDIPK